MATIVSIIIVAVVSYTINLPTKWRIMLFNGAFLIVIILGIGIYFGKKVIDIYYSRKTDKQSQPVVSKTSQSIERSFLDMTLGYGGDNGAGAETEEELLHQLLLLVGVLKKAHTPEAKLRVCNDQISQWREMLILISDDLVSSLESTTGTTTYPATMDQEDEEGKMNSSATE